MPFLGLFHWCYIKDGGNITLPSPKPHIPLDDWDAEGLWDILNGLNLSNLLLLGLFLYILGRYVSDTRVINLTPVSLLQNGRLYLGLIDYDSPKGFLLWFLYRHPYGNYTWMVRKEVEYNGRLYSGMFMHLPYTQATLDRKYQVLANTSDPVEIHCVYVPMCLSRWIFLKRIINVEIKTGYYSNITIDPLSTPTCTHVFGQISDVRPPHLPHL